MSVNQIGQAGHWEKKSKRAVLWSNIKGFGLTTSQINVRKWAFLKSYAVSLFLLFSDYIYTLQLQCMQGM